MWFGASCRIIADDHIKEMINAERLGGGMSASFGISGCNAKPIAHVKERLKRFLQAFQSNRRTCALNHAVIIIFADHGFKFGPAQRRMPQSYNVMHSAGRDSGIG